MLDAIANGTLDAEIAGVFSDKPEALALQRVPETLRWSADARSFPGRPAFDHELATAVAASQPDWVVCAGYMRILSNEFIEGFRGRVLNIHPSLLPSFPGLGPQQQALDSGMNFSGCTVHFVDETLDGGPIIAQRVVPVLEGDTVETLSARILEQEHQLYPEAVAQVLANNHFSQAASS